jgi:hypothetical protein
MKKHASFVLLTVAFSLLSAHAAPDCIALSLTVKHATALEKSRVLEIVSKEVTAAPACACEIVKAAIEGSAANSETVAAIVQSAAVAAPDQMRLVSQCAVAVAPDSLADVQAVIALMDPNLGESDKSLKSEKSPVGEVAAVSNPLDFPGSAPLIGQSGQSGQSGQAGGTQGSRGQGTVGPTPGSMGGLGMFPFSPPPSSGAGGIVFVPAPPGVTGSQPGAGGGPTGGPQDQTEGSFPTD